MDLIDYLGCALLSGVSGAVAGWTTVRRMLRTPDPPRGTVLRGWQGHGHGGSPPRGRPGGQERPRGSRRWPWWDR